MGSLRAITSTDGMRSDTCPFELPFPVRTARRIIDDVKGINRVCYNLTVKRPGWSSGSENQ
jgi:GMP synthase (glutamine-hydrolysing)